MAVVGAALGVAALAGCRGDPPPTTPEVEATGTDEVWLTAGCDLEERLAGVREALAAEGVVPVHGLDGPRWSFHCQGATLRLTVEGAPPGDDGDPVLWVGARGDPPRIVPVRLDVGAGQPDLRRWLADEPGPEARTLAVDLATGVVWRP